MSNHKRRRPRTKSRRPHFARHDPDVRYWLCRWPAWWDIVFHTRPQRRKEKELEKKVLSGADPDEIVWPVDKKPHHYFW